MLARRLVLDSLLAAALCSTAHADRAAVAPPAPQAIALDVAPARLRAPYAVQVLTGDGTPLPTYAAHGRFYVEGSQDERYIIRITNPTARRIEAVVTVDGLDVIDGENGDLRKRGYVVPAYGETRVEGFRTSQAGVATFRFSSVDDSYAGAKGKARNVGVIAVALFEEAPAIRSQIIIGDRGPVRPRAARESLREDAGGDDARASTGAADKAAPPPAPATADARGTAAATAPRPGLGTEFGEQRSSAVSFTQFVRAPGRPVAIAELRYNDAPGLMALGIAVQQWPDPDELRTRETAEPFPGDRFAQPPR